MFAELKAANDSRGIDVLINPYYRRILNELENYAKKYHELPIYKIISNLTRSRELLLDRPLELVYYNFSPSWNMIETEKSSYSEIVGDIPIKIYIGNSYSAYDPDFLYSNNIAAIFNLTSELSADVEDILVFEFPITLRELYEDEFDRCKKILDKIIAKMSEFTGKKILVHCSDGVNRAALVICYYLMKRTALNYNTAYDMVNTANTSRGAKTLTNISYQQLLKSL
jgi:hypothetical protein